MKASIKTLLDQIRTGKLENDKARVLHHIKTHPHTTLSEIVKKLNMLYQTASARLSDLLDMGVIEEVGIKKTARAHETYLKFQPNWEKQVKNAQVRKYGKYRQWVKKGRTQFEEFINPNLIQQL